MPEPDSLTTKNRPRNSRKRAVPNSPTLTIPPPWVINTALVTDNADAHECSECPHGVDGRNAIREHREGCGNRGYEDRSATSVNRRRQTRDWRFRAVYVPIRFKNVQIIRTNAKDQVERDNILYLLLKTGRTEAGMWRTRAEETLRS